MNAKRRADIDQARELLQQAREEEEQHLDNMPANFQSGEKGEAAQEVVEKLEYAIEALEEIE